MAEVVLHLSEWESISPAGGGRTAGLFLRQDRATSELVEALRRNRSLEIQELRTGLAVNATSFVGRVRVGDVVIVVKPKIDKLPLMKLLRYAYGFRDVRVFGEAGTTIEAEEFQELLLWQLLAETRELIARGLYRQYVRQAARLTTPRGRLNFQAIAREPAATADVPCRFHARLEDCDLNRVVLFGLRHGSRLAVDRELRAHLRTAVRLLDEQVSKVRVDLSTVLRVRRELTRLTATYEPVLTIVQILLESEGASLDSAAASARSPGFLFDMNRLFQRLLARFLTENLRHHHIDEEWSMSGMIQYSGFHNPRSRRAPSPRPDFRVRSHDGCTYLLDAKYRDLWSNALPREMLYQLSMYALSQERVGRATILYPTLDSSAKDAAICVREPFSGSVRAEVILRPVNLNRLAELVTRPADSRFKAQREAEAASWISRLA